MPTSTNSPDRQLWQDARSAERAILRRCLCILRAPYPDMVEAFTVTTRQLALAVSARMRKDERQKEEGRRSDATRTGPAKGG
jgi:hypothetical protein